MNKVARDQGDKVAKRVPAGRVGVDEDMAGAAIYLASRAGDYVVGATLVVGLAKVKDATEVLANWDVLKAQERAQTDRQATTPRSATPVNTAFASKAPLSGG